MTVIKFPDIEVDLLGGNGNAFAVMGATIKALRRGGATTEDIDAYKAEAMAGDYDNLLAVTMSWVDVV
jgi:hypothetical protein